MAVVLTLTACARPAGRDIVAAVFAKHGVRKISVPVQDWGKLAAGEPAYFEVAPATAADLQAVVKTAHDYGMPLRVRGRGHSMNGFSLPRAGELLVRTEKLRGFRVEEPGTITVGAAPSLYELRDYLNQHGFTLPVYNDGDMGPSVAGYVSAGGIGPGSVVYGGFWENVAVLTIIDGTGRLRSLTPRDAAFKWFFGGMGQLGVIVEAKLMLLPLGKPALPASGEIPTVSQVNAGDAAEFDRRYQQFRLYWFTLFVPPAEQERTTQELTRIAKAHPGLSYNEPYVYPMKFRTFNPPLVYPEDKDFVGVGLWGSAALEANVAPVVRALEDEINGLARKPRHRRYIQAETNLAAVDYQTYWGSEIYERFRKLKREYDPKNILNRGVFTEP
jgi:FAD/FMN-containing dehydrogenase